MELDGPEQPIARASPVALFRPPSPHPSGAWDPTKRASFSSQVSSRRSSNTPRRRRIDVQRKSDASSYQERRGSLPVVSFRPVEHPPGGQLQQPATLPNYDPRIYEQLSTFTFGAPPSTSAPRSAVSATFGSTSAPGPSRPRSGSQSADETEMSAEEVDEDEQIRSERAKLRALDDGSRRPSLPINLPPGADRRRSTVTKASYGSDSMSIIGVPEEPMQQTVSLPARLEPKELPALPYSPIRNLKPDSPFLQLPQQDLRSRLEAAVYPYGDAAHHFDSEPKDDADGSPRLGSEALNAPSPENAEGARESSPAAGGVMESADFQAILDHEWGTAFHIPGNISPRSSIEDPFMKMIEQLDPVYNRNRYAWTFKKIQTVKKPVRLVHAPRSLSDPPVGDNSAPDDKPPEKEQPELIMWNCQNVGQYGMWPGRTTSGEHKRPSVLYAVSGEGRGQRGPTYLIHKHSRCHAFSIFQGYQVKGQKILASHAMLLSSKAIQYSFANAPEYKSNNRPPKPHEPYEDDPEVQKLQMDPLVEDDNDTPRARYRGHDAVAPNQLQMKRSSVTPDRVVPRKASQELLRQPPRAGPSSFAPTEIPKSELNGYVPPDGSNGTVSTYTPAPRITPHAVAFDAVDSKLIASQALHRASTTRFEWFRRAFGTGRAVGTAPRYSHSHHPPVPATSDSTFSPPWLLMAPQSVKQEEERIMANLNDSFRAVGLIPTPKSRPPGSPSQKAQKPKVRSPIIDSIPRDAMMMLMPLWISEGGTVESVSKHHVPMTERTYLLVYYVPFDNSRPTEQSRASISSKKRTRGDRDRGNRKKSLAASDYPMSSLTEEDVPGPPQPPKKPKKCAFRVVARMLSYSDVRECGIKLPRFGLAVHGSLSDALLGNPSYHALGENFSAVIAVCHGAESGVELVTEGLDKLGLRKNKGGVADEQKIAFGAMTRDSAALEEELEARQQPLTPIGKSVVEMVFAGCISILDVGFR